MKKLILILAFAALMACPALSADGDAVAAAGTTLNASILNYQPVPAHPGDLLEVWVKLENQGGDIAEKASLEFIDNNPFQLESNQRRVHNIGSLPGGYDYVAKFRTRISQDAATGTSYIKVSYRKSDDAPWRESFLPIDIESRITSLSIDSVNTTPEQFEPGQKGNIMIKVRNIADSKMRDVTASLDLTSSGAPLVPVQSSTELKVDSLEQDESHTFQFNVMAKLDAEANAYTVPLNISFKNDKGEEITYDNLVGVVVSSTPDLALTIDSANIYSNRPSGTVTLKFVNKGVDEIKFVYFTLQPHDSYTLLSPTDKYYVGNIDTDDYEIEELQLRANSGDGLTIPLTLEYRDSANKLYHRNETVSLNLVSREEVEEPSSNTGTWVIVILIASGIGIYFWRKKKKAKR